MTTKEEKIDNIVEYLTYAKTTELVRAWNNYCLASGDYGHFVYSYFEFNDLMTELNKSPMEIADLVADVKGVPDYFTYSEYAIEEFDVENDIDLMEVAEYAVEHNDSLMISSLWKLLNVQ